MDVLARGLKFPEGPVANADGSVYLVELYGGSVLHVSVDGTVEAVARPGGGPNGLAVGPDGDLFLCNNGGFTWSEGVSLRPSGATPDYTGGRIEKINVKTGTITRLYDRCKGRALSGPNDIVFDSTGGFYFTDFGKSTETHRTHGAVYYAMPDGSRIEEVAFPLIGANGIGLSVDESVLYVAETHTARIWAFDILKPGVVDKIRGLGRPPHGGRFIAGSNRYERFDSLAIDSAGNICVATLDTGVITVFNSNGDFEYTVETGDTMTTNICFGGADLKRAYITCAAKGELIALPWQVGGHRLAYNC